ncbi:hypothetical protein ABZY19_18775 [Streptomyces sp. NPDC006475]|uniref:hypothetical protein n=1 Tax=unclassified Streptomyces TaxID=2593676 RepID=UPI0028C43926|nr:MULTISPECIES: hypothetical protein [unclassified Streptomyces]WNO73303.1 hypothetical protein RPQ07_17430 [Streptomyces sp. AM8-1-1]
MEKAAEDIRRMAAEGAGLVAMIEMLRRDEDFRLTPLHLLRILGEGVGIPWTESRVLLEFFDPDLRPLVPEDEVDRRAEELLSPYVTREG